jgi:hypothetical protein
VLSARGATIFVDLAGGRASIVIVPRVLRSCSRSTKVAVQYWSWQRAWRRMPLPVSNALAIKAIGSSKEDSNAHSGQVTGNLKAGSCIVFRSNLIEVREAALNHKRTEASLALQGSEKKSVGDFAYSLAFRAAPVAYNCRMSGTPEMSG